jgi:hypothetical protein
LSEKGKSSEEWKTKNTKTRRIEIGLPSQNIIARTKESKCILRIQEW